MHWRPQYFVKGTQSTKTLFEPLGVWRGRCAQAYFFFIKLIGQVIFDNFPLINERDIRANGGHPPKQEISKMKRIN